MEKLQHFRRLFQYEAWANHAVLTNLKQQQSPPPRAIKFLAHIIAAETVWLERIKGEQQSVAVWPEFTLAQCETHLTNIAQLWIDYLAALAPERLAQTIAYTNTKGETFRSSLEDILTHVAMHGAYHRGQIATDTRAAGLTPVLTDFIHAARSGFIE